MRSDPPNHQPLCLPNSHVSPIPFSSQSKTFSFFHIFFFPPAILILVSSNPFCFLFSHHFCTSILMKILIIISNYVVDVCRSINSFIALTRIRRRVIFLEEGKIFFNRMKLKLGCGRKRKVDYNVVVNGKVLRAPYSKETLNSPNEYGARHNFPKLPYFIQSHLQYFISIYENWVKFSTLFDEITLTKKKVEWQILCHVFFLISSSEL